jgi:site-specific DNA-methyltransferase (adenine-specific)
MDITAPTTEAAKQWQGWGTALKPAYEPIIVARKPLRGTVAGNVLEWGTGGINVDGCRIGTDVVSQHGRSDSTNRSMSGRNYAEGPGRSWTGRWPANFIHDGSEEVVGLFPETTTGKPTVGSQPTTGEVFGVYAQRSTVGGGDSGSAARFFYCAKASKRDRDEGLEGFALQAAGGMEGRRDGSIGSVTMSRNVHPTVKPTDLMRYLCRLVTPPGGVVLDPFMGSGSTGKAAILEGFRFIGIEREADYVKIARARIDAATPPLLQAMEGT